jgi:hypothetical protein
MGVDEANSHSKYAMVFDQVQQFVVAGDIALRNALKHMESFSARMQIPERKLPYDERMN